MRRVLSTLPSRLFRDERGQGLAEYIWLLSLIAVVAVAAMTALGQQIYDAFYEPASQMFG